MLRGFYFCVLHMQQNLTQVLAPASRVKLLTHCPIHRYTGELQNYMNPVNIRIKTNGHPENFIHPDAKD